jgi:hypothetical protein
MVPDALVTVADTHARMSTVHGWRDALSTLVEIPTGAPRA